MKLVADESVDFAIIKNLRGKNFHVISILENNSGIEDIEVLKIANENGCLLITEDKDFGELTYRLKLEHKGILLLRLNDMPREKRIDFVTEIIVVYKEELKNCFSVLNSRGLRIKTTHASQK